LRRLSREIGRPSERANSSRARTQPARCFSWTTPDAVEQLAAVGDRIPPHDDGLDQGVFVLDLAVIFLTCLRVS